VLDERWRLADEGELARLTRSAMRGKRAKDVGMGLRHVDTPERRGQCTSKEKYKECPFESGEGARLWQSGVCSRVGFRFRRRQTHNFLLDWCRVQHQKLI
jgi:hypothetical protein